MTDIISNVVEPLSNGTKRPSERSDGQSKQHHEETKSQDADTRQNQDPKDNENPSKKDKLKEKIEKKKQKALKMANPPGGYDSTPVPSALDGYVVKFTFIRAENLPIADLETASSDPFLIATLTSHGIRQRHKEDPLMQLRTRTIHKNTDPVWNQEWIVAGVPSSGFKLKCRIYDEDTNDSDDRLGNVTVEVPNIGESWQGIHEVSYPVKKRMGSWRAYLLKGITMMCGRDISGYLTLSIEVLGKSDAPYGKMYTVGPTAWTKHYSPMIGRIAGTKAPKTEDGNDGEKAGEKAKVERYE